MESTTGTTAGGSVVVPDPGARPPRRKRVSLSIVTVTLSIAFFWFAFSRQLPYYAIAPGSAVDTSQLITVAPAHAHPAKGKVLLTTVSLGKVTFVEALRGWLDPGVDVVAERVITPPNVDEKQFRQLNIQAMDDSKEKAIGVAFEALGVDAIRGSGAEIVQIVPRTPAATALSLGEVIVAVDGAPVALDSEAVKMLGGHHPGDHVRITVVGKDGGAARDVEVTLVEHPEKEGRAFLGVSLTTKDLSFSFPFDVQLRSERIGGPSAGLAFALEVIDTLTEGELTGGRDVAATGTIELDGSVGEVGGVAQKTIAVKRAGASLFLVPRGEYAQAKRFAGRDLDVEIVDNLGDALRILASMGGNGLALPKLGPGAAS